MALTRITSGIIADNTIGLADIADNAVDATKIAQNSILTRHIDDNQITNAHMADDAIDSAEIADGAIDLAHMSVNSIDSDQYVDLSIDTAHIAADAITGAKIADDAIDSEHYTDGSIDTAHIADDQVTLAKMAGMTRGSIIYANSSGNPAELGLGTNDYVLTSDGTDIAWEAASGGAISALNNATANELVTVGSTTTELDAETKLTFDGSTLKSLNLGTSSLTRLLTFTSAGSIRRFHIDGTETSSNTIDVNFVKDINGTETSLLYLKDGKVGIGTTSPANTLDVYASGGGNMFVGRTSQTGGLYIESDGTNGVVRNPANNPLLFQTNGNNTRMAITGAGKVGIGITTPSNLLHVHAAGSSDVGITISNGNHDWTMGIDTSGSDSWTLSRHVGLGNYDLLKINPTSYITIVQGDIHINAYANQMTKGLFFYNDTHLLSGIRNKSNASYNDSGGLEFITSGTSNAAESVKMHLDTQGHLTPGTDDAQDFGSSSLQWRNIYTGDLHLNNLSKGESHEGTDGEIIAGHGNEVDNTNGSWTIQEGANDLFLINKLNNKKYKFDLTEIT